MDPKGTQTGPKDPKMEPQGPQVTKKNNECVPRVSKWSQMCTKGVKMEPQVSQWGPKVPESAKKTQKGPPKCY